MMSMIPAGSMSVPGVMTGGQSMMPGRRMMPGRAMMSVGAETIDFVSVAGECAAGAVGAGMALEAGGAETGAAGGEGARIARDHALAIASLAEEFFHYRFRDHIERERWRSDSGIKPVHAIFVDHVRCQGRAQLSFS